MVDRQESGRDDRRTDNEAFTRRIGRKARRRRDAAARPAGVLLWMRAIGVVGWSVAVPTLVGVFAGLWLDDNLGTGMVSWTLTLLLLGLVIGLVLAGAWVRREGSPRE